MTATQQTENIQPTNKLGIESLIDNIELARQELKTNFIDFENELRHQSNRFIAIMAFIMFALAGIIIAVIKLLF